jgi:hypothetical protein
MRQSSDFSRSDCAGRILHRLIETGVLLLIFLFPWPYASAYPFFEFLLRAGLSVLLVLWAASWVVSGRLSWRTCPVTLCLAGLILLGTVQLVAWPESWLERLGPATAGWRGQLLPAVPERFPDSESVLPPDGATLSLSPTATSSALLRLLCVFLLFTLVSSQGDRIEIRKSLMSKDLLLELRLWRNS